MNVVENEEKKCCHFEITGHSRLEPFVLSVQSPVSKRKFEVSRTLSLSQLIKSKQKSKIIRAKVRENSNFPFVARLWTLNTKASRREWPVIAAPNSCKFRGKFAFVHHFPHLFSLFQIAHSVERQGLVWKVMGSNPSDVIVLFCSRLQLIGANSFWINNLCSCKVCNLKLQI